MNKRHEETLEIKDKKDKVVGKVEGVKPVDKKWEKTILSHSSLTAKDIYVEVKKIDVPREKMIREGENGLNVPKEYFPSEEANISPEKIVELFKKCESFTFNMSNRDSNYPVTCTCTLGDYLYFFINLHELRDKYKLCEDNTNIRIGHHTLTITGESLKSLIGVAQGCYTAYMLSSSKTIPYYFFEKEYEKPSIIERVIDWFFGKPTPNFFNTSKKEYICGEFVFEDVNDEYVDRFLVQRKSLNIRNVYP